MPKSSRGTSRSSRFSRRSLLTTALTTAAAGFGCGFERGAATATARDRSPSPGKKLAYALVRAQGSHRELGRQHGEQAADSIRAHLDHIARGQKLSRAQLHAKALRFLPLFEKYCPHLAEEIRGLAEGAGVEFAEALACNIRGELGKASAAGCTTYVVGKSATAGKEILIGQNSDMSQPNIDMGYVLHLKPNGKPQVLIWTFGGMIGYHGMNNAGVAHFANALGGGPKGRFAMPHYPVKRLMLECSTLDEVRAVFNHVPLASNGNYVVCDRDGGIIDLEANTNGLEIVTDRDRGFIAHTNHYLCPRYATQKNLRNSLADSFPRLERMDGMIQADFGSVTVDKIKSYLSDHSNGPASICRHPSTKDLAKGFETAGRTVASLIAEPAKNRMHVALGNPCNSDYQIFTMDA